MFFLLYVTCNLISGQLGNQMHEIATTLAYAWDHKEEPLFPCLHRQDNNIPMNLKRVFFRLDTSPLPRPPSSTFENRCNFKYEPIPFHHDLMLIGYFQSCDYYKHYRKRLQEIFAPSEEELLKLSAKYETLLSHPYTVAIHVRTFNKEWWNVIPFVGLDYYYQAMSHFPGDVQFVLFSDRINWCKHHFSKIKRNIIFIEGEDHIEDFYLMSMMKHQIIANSSFSWWAAFLNRNPNQKVVAPSHFINPISFPNEEHRSTLLEWKVLPIELNYRKNPYPDDMKLYDSTSKSLDTQ